MVEESLESRISNKYKLVDEEAYNVIGYIPDAHRAVDAIFDLGYTLSKNANGKTVYLAVQDLDEKKDRLKLFQKVGLQDTNSLITGYIADKLDTDVEKDIFMYLSAVLQNGGIEQYSQLVSQYYGVDAKAEIEKFKQAENEFKKSGIESKLINIQKENQNEIQSIATLNQMQLLSYDRAISQYNMKLVADKIVELNKKLKSENLGEVKIITGGGNHDNIYDSQVLKHYLGKEYVHEMNDLTGAIELGKGDEKIKFQVSGNVYGITQHSDNMIYSPEQLKELYPHMYAEKTIVQDFDPKQKVTLEDAMQSNAYNRITNNGTEKNQSLDFLLTHEEFGVKMGFEDKKSPYPNLDNLGLIYLAQNNLKKDENGFVDIYSGHLHAHANKQDNDWMQNKNREFAYIISKDGFKSVNDLPNQHPNLEYDLEMLEQIANFEMKQLAQMYGINLSQFEEDLLDRAA